MRSPAPSAPDVLISEVGARDTTGIANPAQVRRLFTRLRSAIGGHTPGAGLPEGFAHA